MGISAAPYYLCGPRVIVGLAEGVTGMGERGRNSPQCQNRCEAHKPSRAGGQQECGCFINVFFQEAKQAPQIWLELRAPCGPLVAPQRLKMKNPFISLHSGAKKRKSQESPPPLVLDRPTALASPANTPLEKRAGWWGGWQARSSCWIRLPPSLSAVLKAEAMAGFMLPSCCLDQSRHSMQQQLKD